MSIATLGREDEFDRILRELDQARPSPDGARRIVHWSVVAPRRGGLSTFLVELAARVNATSTMIAELGTIDRGLDLPAVDRVFHDIDSRLAARAGAPLGENVGLGGLFERCSLFRKHDQLVVLVLDVAEGIREVEKAHDPAVARKAPLLQQLRFLANRMQDEEPNLAVIVGWDDKFSEQSAKWMARDVVQRYPAVELWPDYAAQDSGIAWSKYADVLQAHALAVDGPFPGFTRTGIPVGVVIDRARELGSSQITGPFLFDVLKRWSPAAEAKFRDLADVPVELLVELCLRDRVIPHGDPLCELAKSVLRNRVEPLDAGYAANESLYESCAIPPARVILSLEGSVRRRYDEAPDRELCVDVCRGIARLLGATVDKDRRDGVATLSQEDLPDSVGAIDAKLLVELAKDEGIPDVVRTDLGQNLLQFVHREPDRRHERLVVFVHRESLNVTALLGGLLRESALAEGDIPILPSRSRTVPPLPVGIAAVGLTAEQALAAVYVGRDPSYDGSDLRSHVLAEIKKHVKQVQGEFPPLRAESFRSGVLSRLIARAYEELPLESLQEALPNLRRDDLKRSIQQLVSAGCIAKGPPYVWRLSEDQLLKALQVDPEPNALRRLWSFGKAQWPEISQAIVDAYGERYVEFAPGAQISAHDGVEGLRLRGMALTSAGRAAVSELDQHGGIDPQVWRREVDALGAAIEGATEVSVLEGNCRTLVERIREFGSAREQQVQLDSALRARHAAAQKRIEAVPLATLDPNARLRRTRALEVVPDRIRLAELDERMCDAESLVMDIEAQAESLKATKERAGRCSKDLDRLVGDLKGISKQLEGFGESTGASDLKRDLSDLMNRVLPVRESLNDLAEPTSTPTLAQATARCDAALETQGQLQSAIKVVRTRMARLSVSPPTAASPTRPRSKSEGLNVTEGREPKLTPPVGSTPSATQRTPATKAEKPTVPESPIATASGTRAAESKADAVLEPKRETPALSKSSTSTASGAEGRVPRLTPPDGSSPSVTQGIPASKNEEPTVPKSATATAGTGVAESKVDGVLEPKSETPALSKGYTSTALGAEGRAPRLTPPVGSTPSMTQGIPASKAEEPTVLKSTTSTESGTRVAESKVDGPSDGSTSTASTRAAESKADAAKQDVVREEVFARDRLAEVISLVQDPKVMIVDFEVKDHD